MKYQNDPNIKLNFEKSVEHFIMQHFRDWKRFSVIAEVRRYKTGEDESIYNQLHREPRRVEVYFDGEYLCDITEDMGRDKALALLNYRLLYHFGGGRDKNNGEPAKIYIAKR